MIKRQICAFLLFAPCIMIFAESFTLVFLGFVYFAWLVTTPCLRKFYRQLLKDSERMFTI